MVDNAGDIVKATGLFPDWFYIILFPLLGLIAVAYIWAMIIIGQI